MSILFFQQILTVFMFASSLQYFAYKRRAGYKDEQAAKLFFYEQLIGAATLSFFIWHPLNAISPFLQFGSGVTLIMLSLVVIYFLHRRNKANLL